MVLNVEQLERAKVALHEYLVTISKPADQLPDKYDPSA